MELSGEQAWRLEVGVGAVGGGTGVHCDSGYAGSTMQRVIWFPLKQMVQAEQQTEQNANKENWLSNELISPAPARPWTP